MYWQIDDGRIWSAEAAAFVKDVPEGVMVVPLNDGGQPGGVKYLRDTILFYGYELGELLTPEERVYADIATLESKQTPRMVRGAALGNAEDVERLAALENQIKELRAQL